jgi:hypothetical protein
MNAFLLAIGCGIATEAVLVGLMMLGGFGPCGPGSLWGIAILLLHEPGIWLAVFSQLRGDARVVLSFVLYAAAWSSLWYLFWRRRFRARH